MYRILEHIRSNQIWTRVCDAEERILHISKINNISYKSIEIYKWIYRIGKTKFPRNEMMATLYEN
jgi:hypothetical protein